MSSIQNTTLTALRNFFLARSSEELSSACTILANVNAQTMGMKEMDWEEAEFAFNRLFVGPMALQAPPYASYYLEAEPQLMGETTLQVRRLYDMAGLVSPLQGHLPDDHLGLELDAALGLLSMIERLYAEEPRALWHYFLNEHLQIWLPKFISKARNAETRHPAIDLALDYLETWFNDQATKQEGFDQ